MVESFLLFLCYDSILSCELILAEWCMQGLAVDAFTGDVLSQMLVLSNHGLPACR